MGSHRLLTWPHERLGVSNETSHASHGIADGLFSAPKPLLGDADVLHTFTWGGINGIAKKKDKFFRCSRNFTIDMNRIMDLITHNHHSSLQFPVDRR